MLASDEKQEKGLIGPGEVDQNAKGEGGMSSVSLDSEQGKINEEKYLSSRAQRDEWAEQDMFFTDGLDPDEVMRVSEENKKSSNYQSKGGCGIDGRCPS